MSFTTKTTSSRNPKLVADLSGPGLLHLGRGDILGRRAASEALHQRGAGSGETTAYGALRDLQDPSDVGRRQLFLVVELKHQLLIQR